LINLQLTILIIDDSTPYVESLYRDAQRYNIHLHLEKFQKINLLSIFPQYTPAIFYKAKTFCRGKLFLHLGSGWYSD
jgi:hypothetical protein